MSQMVSSSNLIKIYLIILTIYTNPSRALREVKLRQLECRWSSNYFSNFTTSVQNNSIDVDIHTIKIIDTGLKGQIEFQIRLEGSKHYQTLFSYTLDICNTATSFKNTIFKNTILMKWFRSFLKYGNFMQNCPVPSGHYYLHGWKLNRDLIPAYLYAGDYRINGYGFYGKLKSKHEKFVLAVEMEITLT